MKKDTHRLVDTSLRGILRDNIRGIQQRDPEVAGSVKLGKRTKLGQRTALRIMHGEIAVTLDTLQQIANGLKLEAWQLLLPGFAPVISAPGPDDSEQRAA